MCLKSIKENHHFLENPPTGCDSPEEASFSSQPVPDSNQLCQTNPALPGQQSSSAQGSIHVLREQAPGAAFRVPKKQQWVWVPGKPLAFKHS